jgi:pimeloyl-ACP methyl ester carboxylesterase
VQGITTIAAAFREDAIPRVPAVVVTADRKPGHSVTNHHARIADALGVQLVSWPGATHNVQLSHPDETLAIVRELVARTSLTS